MNIACRLIGLALLTIAASGPGSAAGNDDLYRAVTIVTGQGEANRRIGFRDCLGKVLTRVSGDPGTAVGPAFEALRNDAGRFVASFSYRDRLEGVPIHDEQGTHDRPHDLTCIYEPDIVDGLLAGLGSRPWLAHRPVLAVFLLVDQGGKRFLLTRDGAQSPYMRESFDLATDPMAMRVVFPDQRTMETKKLDDPLKAGPGALLEAARLAGGEEPLAGSLEWSDADLGWVADWQLAHGGREYRWQARGVSFDEAFRVAIRGCARILSGNGAP